MWQAWHFRDILRSGTLFCVRGAGHQGLFHPCGKRGAFFTLQTLAGVDKLGRCFCKESFGGHVSWQAQHLVNLDDLSVKGSKIVFCEAVVEFDLGHDDDSVWQVPSVGCLGPICRGRHSTQWLKRLLQT